MPVLNFTLKDILDLLSGFGTLGFAVLALYAFLTERVVPRGRLEEQRADKLAALEANKALVAAMERQSDALEARNRLDEQRLLLERGR